ncbi:uncharacterized protein [Malus domestica]|uniref:uncharacterized protein n=1 Tax=Malus domestica TaxID=3750 RepID=UPI00397619AC
MGKTTVLESLMRFCSTIEALYTKEYLRTPTPRDMRRLLRKDEMRGFPDEYDYDAVDEYEPDPMNNSRTRIYCAHDRTEDPVQHEPLERDGRYNELIVQRYADVQEPYWHVTCQNDLIEHQRELHEGEDN